MSTFRRMPLAQQMFLLCAALCAAVFAALILFVSYKTDESARRGAEEALQSQLRVANEILSLAYQSELRFSEQMMGLFLGDLPGTLRLDGTQQRTGERETVPVMRAGEVVINGNNQFIVDFKRRTGLEAAIMVRQGGEFIRVATLLKDKDGKLMIGTPLPTQEPAVQAASRGEKSLRVVLRNERYYLIYYLPIKDNKDEVIGIVTVRSELDRSVEILKRVLSGLKIGETGHLYAVTGDKDKLSFVVHPKHAGKPVSGVFDATQQAVLADMLKSGQGVMQYTRNDAEGRPKPAIAAFTYHPEWNWTLVYGSFIEEFTADDRALRNWLIGFAVMAALVTTLAIFFALRIRMRPLNALLAALDAFGRGDLSRRLASQDNSHNELDLMARQLNLSTQQIGGLVKRIAGSADQVNLAAGQLESSASMVQQSSRGQSESAGAMARNVEDIATGIAQIAEHAATAANITEEARLASGQGKQAVERTMAEMERIAQLIHETGTLIMGLGERSQQVTGIVRNIKEIADQTNLLALNAAIEAARAGEQGRGFAVVADEVRKLAERTSSSAVEIAQQLGAVQEETLSVVERMEGVSGDMQGGVELARQAGSLLHHIQAHADRTAQAVREIASATAEQRNSSQHLTQAIDEVAVSARQNADVTEQNRTASQRLIALAQDLQSMVRQFRT